MGVSSKYLGVFGFSSPRCHISMDLILQSPPAAENSSLPLPHVNKSVPCRRHANPQKDNFRVISNTMNLILKSRTITKDSSLPKIEWTIEYPLTQKGLKSLGEREHIEPEYFFIFIFFPFIILNP